MNSLEQYIYEKLHLTKDNKNLMSEDIDVSDFIESFKDRKLREHIIELIRFCIDEVNSKKTDHKCYIEQPVEDKTHKELPKYSWDANAFCKDYEVGEIIYDDYTEVNWKILYVVTKRTKLPEKYKKKQ